MALSISRIVNVQAVFTPPLVPFPNFSTFLILGISDVIDTHERMREYDSEDAVAVDFGAEAPETLAATAWFAQRPQPQTVFVGRWCKTAASGRLVCGPLSAANQEIAPWNAINNGAFKITIDGVGPQEIGDLDFSASANLNAVAAVIESGFPGGTATCVYDAENFRFVVTSASTGAASTISFATEPDAGTDISGMMGALSTSSGAYEADGVDAQTALETVALFDNQFGTQWYALLVLTASNDDHLVVGAYVEAAQNMHFYGVNTQDGGVIVADDTNNVAYDLKQLGLQKTAVQYSSSSLYAVASMLSRILTTDWQANNSTITLMFKDEPTITPETLTASQMSALLAKNCNVFVQYNNDSAIIQPGICSGGQFVDSVVGVDWLAATIQTSVYDLLLGANKVPQTDGGMHQIATQIEASCQQGVVNGLGAPGVWNATGFGQLKSGDVLPKGYYVYQPPISSQAPADRAVRKSVPFQIAFKLGGAVHEVDATLNVNP